MSLVCVTCQWLSHSLAGLPAGRSPWPARRRARHPLQRMTLRRARRHRMVLPAGGTRNRVAAAAAAAAAHDKRQRKRRGGGGSSRGSALPPKLSEAARRLGTQRGDSMHAQTCPGQQPSPRSPFPCSLRTSLASARPPPDARRSIRLCRAAAQCGRPARRATLVGRAHIHKHTFALPLPPGARGSPRGTPRWQTTRRR
jgi:hypothetical protein